MLSCTSSHRFAVDKATKAATATTFKVAIFTKPAQSTEKHTEDVADFVSCESTKQQTQKHA
jgi:hypothetical protein